MKIAVGILVALLGVGCATERRPLTEKEMAHGQVRVLTTRRDGVSFYH